MTEFISEPTRESVSSEHAPSPNIVEALGSVAGAHVAQEAAQENSKAALRNAIGTIYNLSPEQLGEFYVETGNMLGSMENMGQLQATLDEIVLGKVADDARDRADLYAFKTGVGGAREDAAAAAVQATQALRTSQTPSPQPRTIEF